MRINPFQLVHAMGDARAQDTNLIRYEIPKYTPFNYKTESVCRKNRDWHICVNRHLYVYISL